MRLRVQLLCVCVLGVGALFAGMPTAQAVGLIHMEDWGDDLDAWDIRFVNEFTVLHSENLGTTPGLDAVDITEVPSYQYLIFSRLSWRLDLSLLGPMNDVRRHEDAFYHYSGPACLVGFQGAGNSVELRWRLDHREFTENADVVISDPGDTPHDCINPSIRKG